MKRFDELVALVRADDDFFKTHETPLVGSPEYKHFHSYNEAFMLLDDDSWNILKLKAIQHFPDEREGQRKQSFFNHLNEAFAYRYLREKGFKEVRFMREGKKGPDISYVNRGMKYCEVKTIGLSEDEIGRRSSPHFYDGKVHMRRLRVKFRGADGKPTTEPFPKKPLWVIGARNHSNLMVLLFSLNW